MLAILNCSTSLRKKTTTSLIVTTLLTLFAVGTGCKTVTEPQDVRPLVLRDVPAQRLAYRFEADVGIPAEVPPQDPPEKLAAIQNDFNIRRPNDALLRTVISPEGQRALALYGSEDAPSQAFRIDIYAADGKFLRNLTPPDLACVFIETVSWSPDGSFISFIGNKSVKPEPTPTPPPDLDPEAPPEPAPTVAPSFPAVPVFNTEQIYISNRDGYDLKPLTTRDGLIYFYYSWAPDGHALVALACKEHEWDRRALEFKLPAGRPRLITLDGKERLLDDNMTEALPVWCPDSSKVATAFEADVGIYDAGTNTPTHARAPLRAALLTASQAFQKKLAGNKGTVETPKESGEATGQENSLPPSFNPIVRLEWPTPDRLYVQTAYVRLYPNDAINTFQRWHRLSLTPLAAVLR
ncbi:MAG TPA: hypothetical protein VMM84_06955 [Pyrinomonadaceae bacterium]|nr:hypothetical protein [Pyrinomonadaceae bacterium]